MQKIAVIGIGAMGGPMARRLPRADYELTVCDRNEEALAAFAADGIRTVTRAADCAGCDVVVLLVATPEQVRAVLLGEGGLISGLAGAHRPLIVVMSTIAGATMQALQKDLGSYGIELVDAPVSGGNAKARSGSLSVMMGGRRESCDALRPLMRHFGRDVFHCGGLGAGQTTKIVNNAIGICNLMVSAEAYRIALDNGLKLDEIAPVLDASTGRNFFSRAPGAAQEAYGAWTETREGFGLLVAIMSKDIGLAQALGEKSGRLAMIGALSQVLDGVDDETFESWCRVAG